MTAANSRMPSARQAAWRLAFQDTLPILASFLMIGMGFGVLLANEGFHAGWAFLMSFLIYAGSLQYVAIPLLAAGTPLFTAFLIALFVNARHLIYGLSLLERYQGRGLEKLYLIFGLTDETYSLLAANPHPAADQRTYDLAVTLLGHVYWIVGSTLGGLVGQTVTFNSQGIEFALTALFITLSVEAWLETRDHRPALIGLFATLFSRLLFGVEHFLLWAMLFLLAGLSVLLLRAPGKEAGGVPLQQGEEDKR